MAPSITARGASRPVRPPRIRLGLRELRIRLRPFSGRRPRHRTDQRKLANHQPERGQERLLGKLVAPVNLQDPIIGTNTSAASNAIGNAYHGAEFDSTETPTITTAKQQR